jgi:hypothetical protein
VKNNPAKSNYLSVLCEWIKTGEKPTTSDANYLSGYNPSYQSRSGFNEETTSKISVFFNDTHKNLNNERDVKEFSKIIGEFANGPKLHEQFYKAQCSPVFAALKVCRQRIKTTEEQRKAEEAKKIELMKKAAEARRAEEIKHIEEMKKIELAKKERTKEELNKKPATTDENKPNNVNTTQQPKTPATKKLFFEEKISPTERRQQNSFDNMLERNMNSLMLVANVAQNMSTTQCAAFSSMLLQNRFGASSAKAGELMRKFPTFDLN